MFTSVTPDPDFMITSLSELGSPHIPACEALRSNGISLWTRHGLTFVRNLFSMLLDEQRFISLGANEQASPEIQQGRFHSWNLQGLSAFLYCNYYYYS